MSTKILEIYNNPPKNEPVKLVTHKGRFHSDDVAATAILKYFFNEIGVETEVIRTFTPKEDGYTDSTPNCIVYDIGLGQYDHHQVGKDEQHVYRIDTNKDGETIIRKYAAVGLIWKEIGQEWLGEYADTIYNQIIKYIDDSDNGFNFNPLSNLIRYQNTDKVNATEQDINYCFEEVVEILYKLISNTIRHFKYMKACEEDLEELSKDNAPYLLSDQFLPGADKVCRAHNIPFYIYPNDRGGWCFKTINCNEDDNKAHLVDIPDEVRSWEGVTFLHPSCFLGSAITQERAIEICELLVKNSSK
jgi:uncharacterized UPF0160 family protein